MWMSKMHSDGASLISKHDFIRFGSMTDLDTL